MSFESMHRAHENVSKAVRLAEDFQKLASHEAETTAVENLEATLTENGFVRADTENVSEVLNNNRLLCRSETFSRVVDLLTEAETLEISNTDNHANMCVMASGAGFKTAMVEGFSGKDVGGIVKTVIVFSGEHLTAHGQVPLGDMLWESKPNTAKVSVIGKGEIALDDIKMVSFRFPVKFFPHHALNEIEQAQLEDQKIQFIVRHYIPAQKKTVH